MSIHDQHEEARTALESGVAAVEKIIRERDDWKRRCAEETIAWADEATENRRLHSMKPQGEPSDAVANAVARAIIAHDEDRLTCYDHPEDFCCPCGEHSMSRSEWQRHRARAALRAASAATEQGENREVQE